MPRAVILTALGLEYMAVRSHLSNLREFTHFSGTVYNSGRFEAEGNVWEVGIAQVGMGNAGAAAETERAITSFAPDVALFVGVAGGIKDLNLGDVVAATKIYGYEHGKDETQFFPRAEVNLSSYSLIQRALQVARDHEWRLRILNPRAGITPVAISGALAAGSKVVSSDRSATYEFLRSQYSDAVAVEMEGHGFLVAAAKSETVRSLVVRGISDLIKDKAESDSQGWQETAAAHAAAFAFELLAKYGNYISESASRHRDMPIEGPANVRPTRKSTERFTRIVGTPPGLVRAFFGRGKELQAIRTSLVANDEPKLRSIVLYGLSGMGKSQLVRLYLEKFLADYRWICWIRASSESSLISDLNALADVEFSSLPKELDPKERAKLTLRLVENQSDWLMVFDDCLQRLARDYFPRSGNGSVIVTSINPNWRFISTEFINVQGLERTASTELLRQRTDSSDVDMAAKLAGALGDLPLALEQTAAFVEQSQISLDSYSQLLETNRNELLERPSDFTEYPLSVYAAFRLHLRTINDASPEAIALLFLLAVLDSSHVSVSLAETSMKQMYDELGTPLSEIGWIETYSMLTSYSFATKTEDYFSLHPLVKAFVLDSMDDELSVAYSRFAMQEIWRNIPNGWEKSYLQSHLAPFINHIIALSTLPSIQTWKDIEFYEALSAAVIYLNNEDRFVEAESLANLALSIATSIFGDDNPTTASALMNKAASIRHGRRIPEAISIANRALQILRENDKGNKEIRSVLGVCLSNLAGMQLQIENFHEAEALLLEALEVHKSALGMDNPTVAIDLNNLGNISRDRGNWIQALKYYSQAVSIHRRNLAHPDYRLGIALRNLSTAQYNSGLPNESYESALESLRIMDALYHGTDHPELIESLETMGIVEGIRNNHRTALNYIDRALPLSRNRLGSSHHLTLEIEQIRSRTIERLTSEYMSPVSEKEPPFVPRRLVHKVTMLPSSAEQAFRLDRVGVDAPFDSKYSEARLQEMATKRRRKMSIDTN